MAKASIDMFTKTIAIELGEKGIRVNSINSGGVRTNFFNAAGMDDVQKGAQEDLIRNCSPLNLIGDPQGNYDFCFHYGNFSFSNLYFFPSDIAKLATYLASPDAQFITGSNILIDGGAGLTSSLKLLGT